MTSSLSAPGLESAGVGAVQRRTFDRLAMAHDASHFLLVPQAVVTPGSVAEVANLLSAARVSGIPVTFRSGGTSLSGQAVTDGLLADTRRHFRGVTVLDEGRRVRVQPGATVRQVNAHLARHGYRLGPDPSSESACTLGGVIANNSSGMSCGTEFNSYSMIESAVLVLPSGTIVDTGAPDADALLRDREPVLYQGLLRLRDRIRDDPASTATVRRLFAMKNTMGYGLNSFLDHRTPADILTHLVVGSEGTLAFVAAAVLRTVPVRPSAAAGLLVFDNLADATAALPELVATGPAAIELMDATSLRVGQRDPSAPAVLSSLRVQDHTALLIEYQAGSMDDLPTDRVLPLLQRLPLSVPAQLTGDAAVRAALWHIRKGLYATVAAARPSGSSALLEDIVVPVPELLPTCLDLTGLFDKHGYADSVVFGHAKDGNLHFMITETFGDTAAEGRLTGFTEDLVELVLGHGGSLKAEHGTGRMMASYVRRQYGDELYAVMREVKTLFDPDGLLNPGVIITDDPSAHVRHLKSTPTVEPEVDRCVECGYCEPVCPSKDLTLTPRQRIVLRREIATARASGDLGLAAELEHDYDYAGVQTCAVDGMCQTACPVLINTGDLVRRLRSAAVPVATKQVWGQAAAHWQAASAGASLALTTAAAAPSVAQGLTRWARTKLPTEVVPAWTADLPAGGPARPSGLQVDPAAVAVYFVACVGRMFGPADGGDGVARSLARLVARAGVTIALPADLPDLCCGTPWKSKGLGDGLAAMTDRVLRSLWQATDGGRLPVICDASSCSEGLVEMLEKARASGDRRALSLRVVDSVRFTAETLLPRLTIRRRKASLALHPTCSSTRAGLNPALRQVAAAVATAVDEPTDWGCCAFAGDRGLLHPELTAAATRAEVTELATREHDAYASCNRTCELGMTRATGHPYQHVLEVLDWATA